MLHKIIIDFIDKNKPNNHRLTTIGDRLNTYVYLDSDDDNYHETIVYDLQQNSIVCDMYSAIADRRGYKRQTIVCDYSDPELFDKILKSLSDYSKYLESIKCEYIK